MADQKSNYDYKALCTNVSAARKELAKLRKDIKSLKVMFVRRFKEVEIMVKERKKDMGINTERENPAKATSSRNQEVEFIPKQQFLKSSHSVKSVIFTKQTPDYCVIGHIRTCFKEKNGIPRQGSLCPLSKAELCIDGVKGFTNPNHALEGLENFSHIWLLFIFHKNSQNSVKAKVRPPRLDGKKVGVFASRSPHRPSPVGLTLAHLDGIEGNKLFLSGIDILDGTPVLDIKPYIPDYDSVHTACTGVDGKNYDEYMHRKVMAERTDAVFPRNVDVSELQGSAPGNKEMEAHKLCLTAEHDKRQDNDQLPRASISDWIRQPPIAPLSVTYSENAQQNLAKFHGTHDLKSSEKDEIYCLELLSNAKEVQDAIEHILKEDPRSVYRRNHCPDNPYHFTIDRVNVSCAFRGNTVQVINIDPIHYRSNSD